LIEHELRAGVPYFHAPAGILGSLLAIPFVRIPEPPTGELPTNPTPQPYEPGVAWAPAVPVDKPSGRRRGGRLRWAAAVGVIAVVLGASAAVAALITNSAAQATVLGYVPPGSIVYGEARLDLPGDQRRAVGEFLSNFPGFADQAALETKLDEVLDELIEKATDGDQSYTADIEPWFDGELAMSVGPLPPASSVLEGSAAMDEARALALVSIKDATIAGAWFDAAIKDSGATTTTETYNGATLTVVAEADGPKAAYALLGGEVAVIGDLASVKAAVDTNGDSTFASEPGPSEALASADGDHVGFMYLALRPLLDWSTDLSKAAAEDLGGAAGAAVADSMLGIVPDWSAYWLRVESDALVMEATTPKPATTFGPTENRTSTVVDHIPSTAVVVSVIHDLGKTVNEVIGLYATEPGVATGRRSSSVNPRTRTAARVALARGRAEARCNQQILEHRDAGERMRHLVGTADPRAAAQVRRGAGDFVAAKHDAPGVGRDVAADQVEQGGLAGAVRPDDAERLSFGERK